MVLIYVKWLVFLFVVAIGIGLAAAAIRRRVSYIGLGQAGTKPTNQARRTMRAIRQTFGQGKLWKDPRSGFMHAVMFYGFLHLQVGALDLIWKGLTGHSLPLPAHHVFIVAQEWTVLMVLTAVLFAVYRRYVERLPRLKRGWKPSIVLFFIGGLMMTVIGTMTFDYALEALNGVGGPNGSITAGIASTIVMPLSVGAHAELWLTVGYELFWWLHLLILFSFLIYVPQSKHFHLITAPINLWLKRPEEETGKLKMINLEDEEAESFGVGAIEQFERKQLLDLYACVECGRCTNVCPASHTGKLLSPMHLISKLRDHLTEKGAAVTSTNPWVPSLAAPGSLPFHRMAEEGVQQAGGAIDESTALQRFQQGMQGTMAKQQERWLRNIPDERHPSVQSIELIGNVITEEELWACTTCRNCEDQCPVGNEHVDKIVDMRRYLVLTQGQMPVDGQRALQNIERQGNPWGISRNDRFKWAAEWTKETGITVPTVKERPDFEVLLFVGAMGSYDMRTQHVTKALIRLFHAADVAFAVLGNEERSSGDTARRMGNEFLFQQMCAENIATFHKYGVRRIVTACPHTYHTLKKEYPDFGLDSEVQVYHHTEWLYQLWQAGRFHFVHPVHESVAWHDSCYLARYNGIIDVPRELLRAVPELTVLELERSGDNAMCCGAGGGQMWMEETSGTRVNVARVEQALQVQPSVIGAACPYCLTMMEDGVKAKERSDVRSADIAELLIKSVCGI